MKMPIPGGALQRRMASLTSESLRESPSGLQAVRGVVSNAYCITDVSIPDDIKFKLEENPGLIYLEVMLLDKRIYYLPADISLDEKELIYGNTENIRYRPVEIRFAGNSIELGKVYFLADPLNTRIPDEQMPKPFDVCKGLI
jgi:hypothetical protein